MPVTPEELLRGINILKPLEKVAKNKPQLWVQLDTQKALTHLAKSWREEIREGFETLPFRPEPQTMARRGRADRRESRRRSPHRPSWGIDTGTLVDELGVRETARGTVSITFPDKRREKAWYVMRADRKLPRNIMTLTSGQTVKEALRNIGRSLAGKNRTDLRRKASKIK